MNNVTSQFRRAFSDRCNPWMECLRLGSEWLSEHGYKQPTPTKTSSLPHELWPRKRRVLVDSDGDVIGPEIRGASLMVPDEMWESCARGCGYQIFLFSAYSEGLVPKAQYIRDRDASVREYLGRDWPEVRPLSHAPDASEGAMGTSESVSEEGKKVRLSRKQSVRVSEELYQRLESLAQAKGQSISKYTRLLLKDGAENDEALRSMGLGELSDKRKDM